MFDSALDQQCLLSEANACIYTAHTHTHLHECCLSILPDASQLQNVAYMLVIRKKGGPKWDFTANKLPF